MISGVGGSGKSVEQICYIPVGEVPDIRYLQCLLHGQACDGQPLDPGLADEAACLRALKCACQNRSILLVLDGTMELHQVSRHGDCIDPTSDPPTASAITCSPIGSPSSSWGGV